MLTLSNRYKGVWRCFHMERLKVACCMRVLVSRKKECRLRNMSLGRMCFMTSKLDWQIETIMKTTTALLQNAHHYSDTLLSLATLSLTALCGESQALVALVALSMCTSSPCRCATHLCRGAYPLCICPLGWKSLTGVVVHERRS
jgi:hypothetical protein